MNEFAILPNSAISRYESRDVLPVNIHPATDTIEIKWARNVGAYWLLHDLNIALDRTKRIYLTNEAAQAAGFGLAFEYGDKAVFIRTKEATRQ